MMVHPLIFEWLRDLCSFPLSFQEGAFLYHDGARSQQFLNDCGAFAPLSSSFQEGAFPYHDGAPLID